MYGEHYGASNHSDEEREMNDYYATEPYAAQLLMEVEQFNADIWECACGEKHLSNEFEKNGYKVRSSDIVNRCGNEVYDFLSDDNKEWHGDIITNPPFKYATAFVRKALDIIPERKQGCNVLKNTVP